MDQAMWLARILLMQAGAFLAARGIGDEALWQAVAGGILAIGTAVWSYIARRQALATVPADVAAQLKLQETIKAATLAGRA